MTIETLAAILTLDPVLARRLTPVYASYALPAMRRRLAARAARRSPSMSALPVALPVTVAPSTSGARATDPVRLTVDVATPSAMTTLVLCPLCAAYVVNVHGAARCRSTVATSAAPCDVCGTATHPHGDTLSHRTPDAFAGRAFERCRLAAVAYAYPDPAATVAAAPLADVFAAVRLALAAGR